MSEPRRIRGISLSAYSYAVPAGIAVVALIVVTMIVDAGALAPANWSATLAGAAPIMVLAMAQACAVLSGRGGIDLSVGPLAGLVNAIVVVHVVGRGITAPVVVVGVALAVGLVSGAINGFMIAYLRIPAVVATLGTYLAYLGLTLEVLPTPGGAAPIWLARLTGDIGPVPGLLYVLLVIGGAWALLMRTAYRRNLYAVGADERSAYTSGINVAFTRFVAYCITGLIASVGGLVLTGILQSGDPNVSAVFTLQSIAAVALGGVALSGGRGGLLGAALGALILFLVQNLLSLANVGLDVLQIAYGVMLLLAIALNSASGIRRRRRKASAQVPVATPIAA